MSYPITLREEENNSLTRVRSDLGARLGAKQTPSLITSFSISIWEGPKEKDFISTELKEYVDVSSKLKTLFNSYFASIYSLQIKTKIEDLVTIRN